jgi:hypothetical protein
MRKTFLRLQWPELLASGEHIVRVPKPLDMAARDLTVNIGAPAMIINHSASSYSFSLDLLTLLSSRDPLYRFGRNPLFSHLHRKSTPKMATKAAFKRVCGETPRSGIRGNLTIYYSSLVNIKTFRRTRLHLS